PGLRALRAEEHRRRRDGGRAGLPTALRRVHRGVEPRPDCPGRHQVLPPGPAYRRRATRLELDRSGQVWSGDRGRRRRRVALGPASSRLPAPDRPAHPRRRGRLSVTVSPRRACPARLTRPDLLLGLPRLPWLWAAVGGVALVGAATVGVLAGPVPIGVGNVLQ